MRVSLVSANDVIHLSGNHETVGMLEAPDVWALTAGGLGGWFEPPAPRYELIEQPGFDGAFSPLMRASENRVVEVGGAYRGESTVSVAAAKRRLAALCRAGVVRVVVDDAVGVLSCSGFVSAEPQFRQLSRVAFAFKLQVSCPDPLKYGDPVRFATALSRLDVRNEGAEPIYPVIKFQPNDDEVTISVGNKRIVWTGDYGAVEELVQVDCRTGWCSFGLLQRDDVIRLDPGTVSVSMAGVDIFEVEVSPAWI